MRAGITATNGMLGATGTTTTTTTLPPLCTSTATAGAAHASPPLVRTGEPNLRVSSLPMGSVPDLLRVGPTTLSPSPAAAVCESLTHLG